MTSEEIKAEAQRRIDQMPYAEKKAVWDNLEWMISVGTKIRNLPKQEQPPHAEQIKYYQSRNKDLNDRCAFGVEQGAFETELLENFNITRDDIKAGAKNPFGRRMLRMLLVVFILNLVSAIVGVIGFEYAGAVIAGCEAASGIWVLATVQDIIKFFKFRKIQKLYMKGGTEEEEIRAEIYNRLATEFSQRR